MCILVLCRLVLCAIILLTIVVCTLVLCAMVVCSLVLCILLLCKTVLFTLVACTIMYSTLHSDCNYINKTMIVPQRPIWISHHTSSITFPYELVCEILWTDGFDHINSNVPVLVRSPKLTRFELAQYWGGRPPGNSVVLNPFLLILQVKCRIGHIQQLFLIFPCQLQQMRNSREFLFCWFFEYLFCFFFWHTIMSHCTQKLTKQNKKQKHQTKIFNK